jgi:hypothetical protein
VAGLLEEIDEMDADIAFMASDEDFHDPLSYNFSGLVYRLVVFDKRSVPDHMEPVNALLGCLYGHPKAIEIKTAARISAIIAT